MIGAALPFTGPFSFWKEEGDCWVNRSAFLDRSYEEELRRDNAFDFDDLLLYG